MTTYDENKKMPLEKLIAYRVARELLQLVSKAEIRDARLRDQATRAAQSTALNIAEAAGRQSAADRVRVFRIARGECTEVWAALDIAQLTGKCSPEIAARGCAQAGRLFALLTGLTR